MSSREAFDDLVLGHADRLKAIAYAYLGDHAEAEDVVQAAFFKAWKQWTGIAEGRVEAWIERVVRNEAVDRWRRRRLERPKGTPVEAVAGPTEPESPPGDDPDQKLRQIQEIVSTLSEPYRTVVILRYVQRLSYEQIARELDQPLGTVKTQLCRAIRQIRSRIVGGMGEEA